MEPRANSEEKLIHPESFFKQTHKESKTIINNILNKEYLDIHSYFFGCHTSTKIIEIAEKKERLYTDKFDDHGMRLCPITPCVVFSVFDDDSNIEFQIKFAKKSLIKAFSNQKSNNDGSINISVCKKLHHNVNGDYKEDICRGKDFVHDFAYPAHMRLLEMTFLNDGLKKVTISNYSDMGGGILVRDVCYESENLIYNKDQLNSSMKKK